MAPIINIDINKLLKSGDPIYIELGCGKNKKKGYIGIDCLPLAGVDIVTDLEKGLPFLPDNSVDIIYSKSLLEHIDNFEILMHEIWRVLKPTGKKILFVPHFSNPFYYSDYTHRRFFGLYSFEYFSKSQSRFKRKVPNFYSDFGFCTESLILEFDSMWFSRRIIKRILKFVFNMNSWTQELYEENFCYLFPCYGIKAILYPDK
jgi:predicted SAM-dependent methyltransferase